MFGGTIADSEMTLGGDQVTHAAVFLINENAPRLKDTLYIGPEFSESAAKMIGDSFSAIQRAYREIAGYELLKNRGVIVTTARDKEGAKGFGGDFLNILRLTFHNRKNESEEEIIRVMINTFAHEVAHSLHPAKLVELSPQGRIVSEGSADFFKVLILRRTALLDESKLTEMVSRAYDECQLRRDSHGLLDRVAKRLANSRELYNCGMIYYFALMFDSLQNDPEANENRFLATLPPAFQSAPNMRGDQRCILMSLECELPLAKQMLGDADALKNQRAWFDEKWRAYIGKK
jgi:hypothetical protein